MRREEETQAALEAALAPEGRMKCVLCKHGETHPGQATVTLQRGVTTVILKGVPAAICESCVGRRGRASIGTRRACGQAWG